MTIFQLNCIHNEELRSKCKELINKIPSMDNKSLEQNYDFYLQLKEREDFASDRYNAYRFYSREIEKELKRRKNC